MQQIQSVFSILVDGSWKGLMTQLGSPGLNFWKLVQIQVFAFTCLFPTSLGLWSVDSLEVSLSAEAWERPLTGSVDVLPRTALCSQVASGGAWQWWTVAGLGMVSTWWKGGWEIRKKKQDEN